MAPAQPSNLTESPDLAVLLTTLPSPDAARTLALALLHEGLVACVNLLPAGQSLYMWQGKLCEEAEVLCLLKTPRHQVAALSVRLQALHPYELPEVLVLEATPSVAYLRWVTDVTGGQPNLPSPA